MRSDLQKRVLSLALPAALKQLIDIAQMLVDMLMVGLVSVYALAAVGISMQFMMMINVLMTLYVVGSNALISRYIGAKKFKRASSVLFSAILLAIALAIPLSVVGSYLSYDFFIWMHASEMVASEGEAYFGTITLFITLFFLDNLLFNALSAAGDTKSSLYIKVISTLINLCLNYTLIFGHFGFDAMGVEGAAIATVIAIAFNLVAYSVLIYSKRLPLIFLPLLRFYDIKKMLTIGYPAALERLISSSSFLLFVAIITAYSTATAAGYQIGLRIEGIAFMPGFGFAVAAMALVGQGLGAKDKTLAYESVKFSLIYAALFMGVVGVFMYIYAEFFARFFTQDIQTISEASLYLKLVGISQIPLAMVFVLSGALRGAGATRTTLKINVLSLWFLRVIPSYLAYKLGGSIVTIYIIMTIETFIKGALFYTIFTRKKWLETKI